MPPPRPSAAARWISRWASKVLPIWTRSRWYSSPTVAASSVIRWLAAGRLLGGHPVLALEHLVHRQLDPGRGAGIELVAPPLDLHLVGVLELGQGHLEVPLSDVAPGADHVRPDLDLHARRSSSRLATGPAPGASPADATAGAADRDAASGRGRRAGRDGRPPVASGHDPRARPHHRPPRPPREFEAALTRAREVISAAPGFRSLAPATGGSSRPDRYLLLVEWETLEDHTVGFRESRAFAEWRSHIGPFFDVAARGRPLRRRLRRVCPEAPGPTRAAGAGRPAGWRPPELGRRRRQVSGQLGERACGR